MAEYHAAEGKAVLPGRRIQEGLQAKVALAEIIDPSKN